MSVPHCRRLPFIRCLSSCILQLLPDSMLRLTYQCTSHCEAEVIPQLFAILQVQVLYRPAKPKRLEAAVMEVQPGGRATRHYLSFSFSSGAYLQCQTCLPLLIHWHLLMPPLPFWQQLREQHARELSSPDAAASHVGSGNDCSLCQRYIYFDERRSMDRMFPYRGLCFPQKANCSDHIQQQAEVV